MNGTTLHDEKAVSGSRARWVATAAIAVLAFSSSANAAQTLLFKLSVNTPLATQINSNTGWSTAGGVNEALAAAQLLTNNGLDYRNSFLDTAANWSTLTGVAVTMYRDGREAVRINFNPGSSYTTFFSPANVTGSSIAGGPGYTNLGAQSFNFFGIPGDSSNGRNWFINRNYGGCGADFGWMAVVNGTACGWETSQKGNNSRAFLYSGDVNGTNWNAGAGNDPRSADVFAVFAITPDGTTAVPLPASLPLLGGGLLVLGALRRGKGRQAPSA